MQKREGFDPEFAAAVTIASAPTGMLIPPSTAFIIYSLVAGGASISALFPGRAVAGVLWGLGMMVLTAIIARRRGWPVTSRVGMSDALRVIGRALPSLMMILLIIGGIIMSVVTAVEASGIAVIYTMLLAFVIHRTNPISELPRFLMETVHMTGTIMLLLAASAALSFSMALTGIPAAVTSLILAISDNPVIVMLIINIALLVPGCFMDMGPVILIFTLILLLIVQKVGYHLVHFGVVMIFNLASARSHLRSAPACSWARASRRSRSKPASVRLNRSTCCWSRSCCWSAMFRR